MSMPPPAATGTEGNTDSSVPTQTPSKVPKKRNKGHSLRSKNWFFTWNNYAATDIESLLTYLKDEKKYAFQEEIGDEKTPHLQGCISFKNAKPLSTLKKFNDKIHWEITHDFDAAVKYCTKDKSRNGNVYTKGIPKPLKDPIKTPYPWQSVVLEELKSEPNDRTINWIWDETGNIGKTSLAKHICMNRNALYVAGKSTDVKAALATHLEEHGEIEIVLWDIPRTSKDYISYEAIESLKNGICFSGKYESKQLIFNSPHIYIFANFMPNTQALSKDRWNIREVNTNKEFI